MKSTGRLTLNSALKDYKRVNFEHEKFEEKSVVFYVYICGEDVGAM
jgi:hypothetical protein